jgi:hypothetical protein
MHYIFYSGSKKMKAGIDITRFLAMTAAMILATELSAGEADSGFLDDYSKLKPIAGTSARAYTAPGALKAYENYKAVMIDQPEFVIAADSKYRGIKPDEAKAVADMMRQAMSKAVSKSIPVVDIAGPGVLHVRIAASNVHLNKKKRGLLSYTPAGFVVTEATQAGQEMEQKIVLQDMNLEIEVMDSQTQKVLAAMVDKIEPGVKKPGESWSSEQEMMDYWSNRLDCRLENARKPEDQWQDCAAKK